MGALGSIFGASRFKYFLGPKLFCAICLASGAIDSFEHLVGLVKVGPPPEADKLSAGNSAGVAKRADNIKESVAGYRSGRLAGQS